MFFLTHKFFTPHTLSLSLTHSLTHFQSIKHTSNIQQNTKYFAFSLHARSLIGPKEPQN
jgi:hypothetical protein